MALTWTDVAAGHGYFLCTGSITVSLEQLKAFLAKIKADSNLQDKLKAAKSPDEVVSIAKDHGHEFTTDKLNQLSEEELDGVSGGYQGYRTNAAYRSPNCGRSP